MLNTIYTTIVDFLFPPHCPLCGAYVDTVGAWCPACLDQTIQVHKLPLSILMQNDIRMVRAVGRYRGGMKKFIQALKYQKKLTMLPAIHTLLDAALPKAEFAGVDYVIPVPLHSKKLQARGFNQAEKIFHPWANGCQLNWLDALIRCRDTKPQYKMTVMERRINMRAAFSLREGLNVRGKKVLLVDDIFTTGVTIQECAMVLKQAGAKRICGLTLASDA